MKKSNRSVLAFVLALVMLLGLCVPTLATSGEFESYDTYLCIGDSVFAGTGMPLPEGTEVNTSNMPSIIKETADEYYWGYDYSRVSGSCHDLIAKALSNSDGGATELIQGARSALRAVEVRYMLEGGVLHDAEVNNTWDQLFYQYEDGDSEYSINDIDTMNSYVGGEAGKSMVDQVQKADLITVELGLNDVFGTASTILYNEYTSDDSTSSTAAVVKKYLGDGDEDIDRLTLIRMLLEIDTVEVRKDFEAALAKSLEAFEENYTAVLDDIHKLNPKAEVVTVGGYNPFESAADLLDILESASKMSVKVHTFVTAIRQDAKDTVASLNTIISNTAAEHGYRYVDISKTKTWGVTTDTLKSDHKISEAFAKLHPSADGHKYIAEQVLGVLSVKRGDLNGDGYVTDADALYLHYYIQGNKSYTVSEPVDYNGDEQVDEADAILLLNHSLNPSRYTLH